MASHIFSKCLWEGWPASKTMAESLCECPRNRGFRPRIGCHALNILRNTLGSIGPLDFRFEVLAYDQIFIVEYNVLGEGRLDYPCGQSHFPIKLIELSLD